MACDRSPGEGEGRGLRQVPRRGGRKGVAPLNKGLSRSDWGLDRQDFMQGIEDEGDRSLLE